MRVRIRDDVALHVDQVPGNGVPFLLAHGLASNARLWTGVARRLAADGHAVAAVDLRGHGASDAPNDGYDTPTVADDVRLLIERLGWDRPVVVGQSWGGNVALELAVRHQTMLRGVGCVDGGVTELADRFPDWETCRAALTPPDL